MRATPPITAIASPKSAWAGPGEWTSGTNIFARPKPPLTDIVLHDGVAAGEPVLVPETVEDPLRRGPLLVVAGPIVFQNPIDDPRERTPASAAVAACRGDTPAAPRTTASCGPSCGPARTPARPRGCSFPRHDTPAEPARTNPPDTSPRLPVRVTLTEGYRRSHFGPPQPDQPAASVGDYCAAVLRTRTTQRPMR